MRYLKVAGAALNQTPLDWEGNRRRIVAALREARERQVQVLCLPELCISGYGCEDAFHGESVAATALESLAAILPETKGLVAALGLPLIHEGQLFNAAALAVDGALAGLAVKRVLAGYGVHYEPRWFKAWPSGEVDTFHFGKSEVPIGDLLFDVGGVRLGFEICEDAWGRGQQRQRGWGAQADLLLNPSASHFAFGKYATLRGIVAEGSRTTHSAYVYANLVGNEAGRMIYDGTVLIAAGGELIAENPRFSYHQVQVTSAVVDLGLLRLERRRLSYPLTEGAGGGVQVQVPFNLAEAEPADVAEFRAPGAPYDPFSVRGFGGESVALGAGGAPPLMRRQEEFARAVSLGLWDYLRKTGSHGFAVSLSGGVDSATVAVLCWIMVRLALTELGAKGVREALGHMDDLPPLKGAGRNEGAALLQRLLLTVYQATENSSAVTRKAAGRLSEQLGARHVELEIGEIVAHYERLAEQALGRPLDWKTDDLARQNIQARVRSPGIWLLANLERRLLLGTSNRSEVGVGYMTMDGDTSGGLAPIAGANKTFLRRWLRHVENQGVAGLGPLSALQAVNAQAPTAELRPQEQGQEDEQDLMPYPVLDTIEQAAIRDRLSPVEVWRTLLTTPLDGITLDKRKAADYVERFYRLWGQSQWKRERMAPSFHLDDENLDPRTWCRFPILSGGYETELQALRRAVAGK